MARIYIKTNKKIKLYQSITFAYKWIFENIKINICAICSDENGKQITAYRYKWEYYEIIVYNEELRDINS